MNKLLLSLLLIFGLGFTASADPKSRKELRGDKQFFVYRFEKAIDAYTHTKELTVEGQRRLAKSYSNLGLNTESESAYARLVSNTDGTTSDDYYNYAMILKANNKTDQSDLWMDKFAAAHPNDLRAKDYKANHSKRAELSKDDGKYKVDYLNINTEDDDYGTSYFNNQIVFSSSRAKPKMIVKKYNWTGKAFGDIFVADVDGSQLKDPENFGKKLNGKMHDGPVCFSRNNTYLAFTRNNYETKRKDRVINLEICFSTLTDGKWSDPEPFYLNNIDYSVGHPSLSADGNTMYFSSNMSGGYGGADIYKVVRNGQGEWGAAQNMGSEINTEGNEMFPFFEEKNGILFFASDGRFGLGGLDIFVCPMSGGKSGTVVNAGAPMNTTSDDFAFITDSSMDKGYLSSNRAGGKSGDDIYAVDILNGFDIGKKIQGIAKDKNGKNIPASFITLYDDKNNVLDTLTTKEDGSYEFLADANKTMKLTGQKDAYTDGTSPVSTSGSAYIVNVDLVLLDEEKEVTIVKAAPVGTDLGTLLVLNAIYFDLNESAIRPDAETELLKIVKAMNASPTMVVEISAYTDCRESDAYNQSLSDRRAQASVNFIKTRITKPERISGKGYGESNLVNDCACDGAEVSNCSEAQHQKNRRTEFRIVKK